MKATTIWTAAAAVVFIAATALPAAAEVQQELALGVQGKNVHSYGLPQSKLEEYHPYPTGGVLDLYSLQYGAQDYELEFYVKDLDEARKSFKMGLEGGKPGVFTYSAAWDQIPHIKSYDAQTIYGQSGVARNYLTMDLRLRAANQGAADGTVRDALNKAIQGAPFKTLEVQSDKGSLDLAFHPAKDVTVSFGASRLHKEGARSMGANVDWGAGAANGNPVILPAPINTTTHEAYFEVGYAKKEVQAGFRYDVSVFHNMYQFVVFDNPADAGINGATPPQGRISMEPDNIAQTFSWSGGVELPHKTRFSGEVGFSLWRQDQNLLPFTINPAAGRLQSPDALPTSSAGGKIDVITQNYKLSNSALEGFRTSVEFTGYDYEDHSRIIFFPTGYVDRDADDFMGDALAGVGTNRYQYRVEDWQWKGDLDLSKNATLNAGYTLETDKEGREIPLTYEHRYTLGLVYRPSADLLVNASYLLGRKRAKGFDLARFVGATPIYQENPGLVRFDQADRNRDQARLQIQYAKGESSYGFSYRLTRDRYLPGRIPLDGSPLLNSNLWEHYGVLNNDFHAASLNVTRQLSGAVSADVYCQFDYSSLILANTANNPNAGSSRTDWTSRITQLTNVAGLALDVKPSKDVKLRASYDFSSTIGHNDPLNGAGFPGNNAIADTTSASLPSAMTRRHRIGVQGRVQAAKALGLFARYMFQKYELADYLTSNIPTAPNQGGALYMGNSQSGYSAHLVAVGADLKF